MSRNILNKNPKICFQVLSIFFSLLSVILILLIRTNKVVLIESLYEELMIFLPRISSLGNLVDESGEGSQNISKKKKFYKLAKYVLKNPLQFNKYKEKNIPELNILIPYENLRIIQEDRINSIKKGHLSNPSSVKGTLWFDGIESNIRVRLKGDLPTHWAADKRYSLRIKMIKEKNKQRESILGMKTFSLHKLRARAYPYEYVFQDLIKKFKFPKVSHRLVRVRFNGDYWGIMDMQEHWGVEMLEKNKLKDSLILRFGSDVGRDYSYASGYKIPYYDYWLENPRLFFGLSGMNKKDLLPHQKVQYEYILNSLKKPDYYEKLFSEEKLLKLDEILRIWGNFHPIHPHNSRFYFNPYTLKLEPFVHDQSSFRVLQPGNNNSIYSYTGGFIKTNSLNSQNKLEGRSEVIKELSKLTPYNLSKKFFPDDKNLNISIAKENLIKINNFDSHNKYLNSGISPQKISILNCSKNNKKIYTKNFPTISASFKGDNLFINRLICGDVKINYALICDKKFNINKIIKNKNIFISKPDIINLTFNDLDSRSCIKGKNLINYTFNKENKIINIEKLQNIANYENPLINSNIPKFVNKISFNTYKVSKGNYIVNQPINLKGNLEIEKGTNFIFKEQAYLIIDGNLFINGTIKEPVIMKSSDDTSRWKGIYLFSEGKREDVSIIKNLKIDRTDATQVGILNLTGGFTVYNKNIQINNLKISNSSAEDALNIIKSNVKISDLQIKDSRSDAFDCDFCEGVFDRITFENVGGDGLDISGSNVDASIIYANNVKDKVASIGEKSIIDINISNVKNSYVAAAIKDSSLANIKLFNIETKGPIAMTYIKKDFYEGPTKASISFNKSEKSKYLGKQFLSAKNTSLFVNDKKIKTSVIDVDKLYSFGPMKK